MALTDGAIAREDSLGSLGLKMLEVLGLEVRGFCLGAFAFFDWENTEDLLRGFDGLVDDGLVGPSSNTISCGFIVDERGFLREDSPNFEC